MNNIHSNEINKMIEFFIKNDMIDRISLLMYHPNSDIVAHSSSLESLLEDFNEKNGM